MPPSIKLNPLVETHIERVHKLAKGISLSIGLNSVDPGHYEGWSGELSACESDAKDLALIAKSKGFATTVLLTKQATRKAVMNKIASAASTLKAGDIFLITYSGHGGQLPDLNSDEDDGQDETWCLYDGEYVDDQLYAALSAFAAGVRIFALSDSCHSGTVLKVQALTAARSSQTRYRAMPSEVAHRTYLANKKEYDKILGDPLLAKAKDAVKASAILISGCQDNQLSSDGTFNGLFTGTLKSTWNGGKFSGGYRAFCRAIVHRMPGNQTPNFFTVGRLDRAFEKQEPFTV